MKNTLKAIFVLSMMLINLWVYADNKRDTILVHKSLKTIDGKIFNFSEFTKNKASVMVFMAPDCPISQKYTLTLREIAEKYKDKNISVYLIFPGSFYTKKTIREFLKKYLMEFPVILDEKLEITKMIRASITPEAYLFDNRGEVIYSGRIDNWFESLGKNRFVITERDLVNGIDAYLSGEEIKVKKTKSVGCIIQY